MSAPDEHPQHPTGMAVLEALPGSMRQHNLHVSADRMECTLMEVRQDHADQIRAAIVAELRDAAAEWPMAWPVAGSDWLEARATTLERQDT